MSQRTGIPLNMVAKAKKMLTEGISVEHVAQHYRCPVHTIQSFATVIAKEKAAEAKAKIELAPDAAVKPLLAPAPEETLLPPA